VYLEKDKGTLRPSGIPTFEDKIAQRAVVMLLEPLYEQDFRDCAYGFRPGRSPHQALEALRQDLRGRNGQWILDLDISNYFGTIDHRSLRTALDQRVKDGLVRKRIDKGLKAGVPEEGIRTVPAEGTPQGGVLSPLPANVFLHYVLDTWFHRDVVPRLRGRRRMVRFADEAVCVFEHRVDAERVREVLEKRLAKLWHSGQRPEPWELRVPGAAHLAQVAQTPQRPAPPDRGEIHSDAPTAGPAGAPNRSHLRMESLSEPTR